MRETSECRPASSGQSVAVVIVNDAPSNTVVTLSYFFSLSYFPFLPVSVPYLFLSLSSPRAFLFYLNRTAIRPLNHRTTQLSNHPCFPPTQPPTYPATTHPSYRANQPSDRINRSSEIYTRFIKFCYYYEAISVKLTPCRVANGMLLYHAMVTISLTIPLPIHGTRPRQTTSSVT